MTESCLLITTAIIFFILKLLPFLDVVKEIKLIHECTFPILPGWYNIIKFGKQLVG